MSIPEWIATLLIIFILALGAFVVGIIHVDGISPNVTAAWIGAIAALITVLVNVILNGRQHREKIASDMNLAAQRFAYERQLAEEKTDLERRL